MKQQRGEMATTDHREKLSGLPLLKGLPNDTRDRICAVIEGVSEETTAASGEELLQEGHLAFASGYFLVAGSVKVEREGLDPIELEAPMLLGEMSQFIQDDSRTATVRVASDASFLKFSWDDLYARAGAELSKEENAAFIQAIEKVVWDRYDLKGLMDLAFLSELSDDLKVRVCLPFPWISKRVKLANNEPLFESAARCKARGYLLIRGRISLIWIGAEEKVVAAPNIIGIMPNNKPERIWSASARANGEAELLAFSWIEYGAKLEERLSNKEMKQFFDSLKNNAKRHFWH